MYSHCMYTELYVFDFLYFSGWMIFLFSFNLSWLNLFLKVVAFQLDGINLLSKCLLFVFVNFVASSCMSRYTFNWHRLSVLSFCIKIIYIYIFLVVSWRSFTLYSWQTLTIFEQIIWYRFEFRKRISLQLFLYMYRGSFIILCYDQRMNNYFTNITLLNVPTLWRHHQEFCNA